MTSTQATENKKFFFPQIDEGDEANISGILESNIRC